MSDMRPILLLDVDGVLNVITDDDPPTWSRWQVSWSNMFPFRWSPDMIAALNRLAERVEIRWLTTWWDITDRMAFLGLASGTTVANTREEFLGSGPLWWKLGTAKRIAAEGRPVIWIDDDLRYDWEAKEWARTLPAGALLTISPDSRQGLTPEAIGEIEQWLDTHHGRRPMSSSTGALSVVGCIVTDETVTPDGWARIDGTGS